MGGATSPLAPVVEITTPVAADDPNLGPVLVDDQVTVLCTAKASTAAGAAPVDASTVKIEMFGADGKLVKSSAGATTDNSNEYAATFVLAPLPSGPVTFQCGATDTASPAHSGMDQIDTLVDHGPEIIIGQPLDKSAHKLLGAMNVEFSAAPVLIAEGDNQASVSGVTLTIGGTVIPSVNKGGGNYQATVDFSDKALYGAPPSGTVPVVITASNQRKVPGKATHTLAYGIVVDGVGPVIALGSPAIGSVIGPDSVFTFNVTDPGSGVDRATVAVTLNDETSFLSVTDSLWTWDDVAGSYSFKIGSALATKDLDPQVTVNVLAKDNAGNVSMGTSRIYNLDNRPPVVDLDPPDVFETRPGSELNTTQCSDWFDPLGRYSDLGLSKLPNGSPNDLATIVNFGRFRSLVWDETNRKPGQSEGFPALTDRESVRLYVQADVSAPLLRDFDSDGVCDEIWTGSIPNQRLPTDQPLPFLKLVALTPTGNPSWDGLNTPNPGACKAGSSLPAFRMLCGDSPGSSDMAVVIRHSVDLVPFEPVIYAIEPNPLPTSLLCTGKQWDVSAVIGSTEETPKLGWVCLAARAVDLVGNPGISPPLRVCLDDGTNPDRCKNVPPPSCTDNCTPPPHFTSRAVNDD